MLPKKLIAIGETAKKLGVSLDTLRRWDATGKFPSIRKLKGHRYYNLTDIDKFIASKHIKEQELFAQAKYWASSPKEFEPENLFYCQNASIFQSRIMKLEKKLAETADFKDIFSLIIAVAGEIGNNSFDHNLGNWPDIPGIFFAYDVEKREVVLADRGQGILKTLKRVRPSLEFPKDALQVAFTEIISGRAPEERGNGLKFVKNIITANNMALFFQSGNAEVEIKQGDKEINIKISNSYLRGCIALIKF